MQFIDLHSQLESTRPAIDARIKKVLDHGQFIMGPEVAELEEKLANYVGVKHCISCANGTDALQLSLMSLEIGSGDIVFTTAFSFFATAEVIPLVGATPYFVDIEIDSYNLCPKSLEEAIINAKHKKLGKCKAVIVVDLFGLPANYSEIKGICDRHNLHLIEDAAQSFGGAIGNQMCGSFGNIATTSFFPAKPLGCYGDGGAIFTDNDKLAEICKSMRVHGKGQNKYDNVRIGLNSRLDTIQAAILLEKLVHFSDELAKKTTISEKYIQSLKGILTPPNFPSTSKSALAQFTLRTKEDSRSIYIQELNKKGIPTAIYYPKALNQQQALLDCYSTDTPNTNLACKTVFSIPMHAFLTDEQTSYICNVLIEITKSSIVSKSATVSTIE